MKLISLWQPWASLMAVGAKKIETRHWGTPYRGPLLIHATQTWNGDCRNLCEAHGVWQLLGDHRTDLSGELRGKILRKTLPFGSIVAVCNLVSYAEMTYCGDCDGCGWLEGGKTIKTPCEKCAAGGIVPYGMILSRQESDFGNYAIGRYGLLTEGVFKLPDPIPFKSQQGKLLDVPEEIQRLVRNQMPEVMAS